MDRSGDDLVAVEAPAGSPAGQSATEGSTSAVTGGRRGDQLVAISPETVAAMHLMHERICKSIADPKRLLMLHALRQGELNVGELAEVLSISQPNASQHIAVLRDRGMVIPRRDGTTIYYRLASERIIDAIDLMWSFLEEDVIGASPAPGSAALMMRG